MLNQFLRLAPDHECSLSPFHFHFSFVFFYVFFSLTKRCSFSDFNLARRIRVPVSPEGMVTKFQVTSNSSVSLPPITSSPASSITRRGSSFLLGVSSSVSDCHGLWFDVVLVVPSVVFVVYLALHAKTNLKKLCNGRSYIMVSYYALLWIASLLNLAWCSLQVLRRFFSFKVLLFYI